MHSAVDYIATPKGQALGGPVQSSMGEWFVVLLANGDVAWHVESVILPKSQSSHHGKTC